MNRHLTTDSARAFSGAEKPILNDQNRRDLDCFLNGERRKMLGSLRKLERIMQSEENKTHVRAVIEYAEEMQT